MIDCDEFIEGKVWKKIPYRKKKVERDKTRRKEKQGVKLFITCSSLRRRTWVPQRP